MKFIILIIILLSLPFKSSSPIFCICPELKGEKVAEIKKNMEVIVVGKFTKQIEFGEYDDGVNINGYFKIDTIIKGPTDLKNLVINQFSNGNCRELFEPNKQYLVLGNHITKFKDMKTSNKSTNEHLPPPPPNEIHNSIMECYSSNKTTIKQWNQIAERNYIIHTNQCLTFELKERSAKLFME